ncbi:MAG: TIGR03067 domain-containing protein [Planctomycetes bacterium]|nr:TIGR03067 domain-containing protein [Planctomycetota bacterium]
MRRSISVASLVLIGLFAKNATAQDTKLLGTWLIISAKEAGVATKEPVGDKVTFSDTKMTVQPKDPTEDAPPPLAIKIDATKTPRQIDITFKKDDEASVVKAIFGIQDGVLKLCMAAPGEARPTTLESKKDTRQFLLVLKRAKEE